MKTTNKINKNAEAKLLRENDGIRVFKTDGISCSDCFYSPSKNKIIPATITFDETTKSITIAFADGGEKLSAQKIAKSLWKKGIQGTNGIAHSSEGKEMTLKDLEKAINATSTNILLEKLIPQIQQQIEDYVSSLQNVKNYNEFKNITQQASNKMDEFLHTNLPSFCRLEHNMNGFKLYNMNGNVSSLYQNIPQKEFKEMQKIVASKIADIIKNDLRTITKDAAKEITPNVAYRYGTRGVQEELLLKNINESLTFFKTEFDIEAMKKNERRQTTTNGHTFTAYTKSLDVNLQVTVDKNKQYVSMSEDEKGNFKGLYLQAINRIDNQVRRQTHIHEIESRLNPMTRDMEQEYVGLTKDDRLYTGHQNEIFERYLRDKDDDNIEMYTKASDYEIKNDKYDEEYDDDNYYTSEEDYYNNELADTYGEYEDDEYSIDDD